MKKAISKPNVALFLFIVASLATAFLIVRPFIFKQTVTTMGLSLDYPSSWFATVNRDASGQERDLVISTLSGITLTQQSVPQVSGAEITVTIVPKRTDKVTYVGGEISRIEGKIVKGNRATGIEVKDDLDARIDYDLSFYPPDSKIEYQRTKFLSKNAVKATIEDPGYENFYSKEILIYLDKDSGYFYRISGGTWRYSRGIQKLYLFNLVNQIFESIKVAASK